MAIKKQKSDPNARGRFVWEDGDIDIYSPEEARKAFPEAFADEVQSTATPREKKDLANIERLRRFFMTLNEGGEKGETYVDMFELVITKENVSLVRQIMAKPQMPGETDSEFFNRRFPADLVRRASY